MFFAFKHINHWLAPQESSAVTIDALTAKGIKPYGPGVDIWATGVLAYELVVGRPPFEVDNEAETAALIMYSDNIVFPPNKSSLWAEFVRQALTKNPASRPCATKLLAHGWCARHAPRLLQPAPRHCCL